MPKFKNTVSGVVVSVDAEAAMRLPGSWEPFEDEEQATAPRRRASRKKAEPKSPPTVPDDLSKRAEDVADESGESDDDE